MSINNDKYLPHRLTGVPPLRVFSLSLSLYLEMIFKFKQKKKNSSSRISFPLCVPTVVDRKNLCGDDDLFHSYLRLK
jgi:hypothetical protein